MLDSNLDIAQDEEGKSCDPNVSMKSQTISSETIPHNFRDNKTDPRPNRSATSISQQQSCIVKRTIGFNLR